MEEIERITIPYLFFGITQTRQETCDQFHDFFFKIQMRWIFRFAITLFLMALLQNTLQVPSQQAAMSCVNYGMDHCVRIRMRAKRTFHQFETVMENRAKKGA